MTEKGARTMPKTEYVIEPGKQEIISTTILDAPRELVFKAYTDPKLFAQWWVPGATRSRSTSSTHGAAASGG